MAVGRSRGQRTRSTSCCMLRYAGDRSADAGGSLIICHHPERDRSRVAQDEHRNCTGAIATTSLRRDANTTDSRGSVLSFPPFAPDRARRANCRPKTAGTWQAACDARRTSSTTVDPVPSVYTAQRLHYSYPRRRAFRFFISLFPDPFLLPFSPPPVALPSRLPRPNTDAEVRRLRIEKMARIGETDFYRPRRRSSRRT